MKVVLDTNVMVSALLKRSSVPGRILHAVWSGELQLLVSDPLLRELRQVLEYPKIRNRLASASIDPMHALELLPFFSVAVELDETAVTMPRDEDDWMVLATLVAGRGDWLISGYGDLLALAPQYAVITPAAFVARFLS